MIAGLPLDILQTVLEFGSIADRARLKASSRCLRSACQRLIPQVAQSEWKALCHWHTVKTRERREQRGLRQQKQKAAGPNAAHGTVDDILRLDTELEQLALNFAATLAWNGPHNVPNPESWRQDQLGQITQLLDEGASDGLFPVAPGSFHLPRRDGSPDKCNLADYLDKQCFGCCGCVEPSNTQVLSFMLDLIQQVTSSACVTWQEQSCLEESLNMHQILNNLLWRRNVNTTTTTSSSMRTNMLPLELHWKILQTVALMDYAPYKDGEKEGKDHEHAPYDLFRQGMKRRVNRNKSKENTSSTTTTRTRTRREDIYHARLEFMAEQYAIFSRSMSSIRQYDSTTTAAATTTRMAIAALSSSAN